LKGLDEMKKARIVCFIAGFAMFLIVSFKMQVIGFYPENETALWFLRFVSLGIILTGFLIGHIEKNKEKERVAKILEQQNPSDSQTENNRG
jgi:hypothetical protein